MIRPTRSETCRRRIRFSPGVATFLFLLAPTQMHAQEAPRSTDAELRLGHTRVPFPWETRPPVASRWVEDRELPPGASAAAFLARRRARLDDMLRASRDTLWMALLEPARLPDVVRRRVLFVRDTTERGPGAPGGPPPARPADLLPGALGRVADLDLDVDGQGQIRARWETFAPCQLGLGQRCNAGAVPNLAPEFQLRAVARGTISERVHVNVDFDQTREFSSTNDLTVFYAGKPDEILRSVELGEVSMALPRSEFISQGIPAGNFGVRADAQFGPLSVQSVVAEQGGNIENRSITLDVGGTGTQTGVLQDFEAVLDDVGYQTGQFFFIVDPRFIAGYPNIDVLNLQGTEVPDSLRPTSAIKLYRHEVRAGSQPQNIDAGVIQATGVAVRPPGADPSLPDSVTFRNFYRPLTEGEDYIVHRSGLWIAVRNRVLRDEALATAYVAVSGDTVGDFQAEEIFRNLTNTGSGTLPRLVLLRDPATHRPGGLTWEREMHQIYRITGSDDVEAGSVELTISQGPIESGPIIRTSNGVDFTFLEIFGLDDQPRDDRLDQVRIWQPRNTGEFAGNSVVAGNYLVFPTLEPFKNPPPLRASRVPSLQGQPFPLAPADRSTSIYDEPIDQTRNTSSQYRLNFRYRARSSSRANAFPLGAIGIREGSERVTLNGQELVNGQDYTVDYDIGQLTLLRPDELLSGAASPQLNVTFEQKPLFQIARKTIIGFTGSYRLADWGRLNFIGLSQKESTVLTRPELGLEPAGIQLGGVTADVDLEAPALTRFMNHLPGIRTDVGSRVRFSGEVAGSAPTTNRFGVTFVDDFESSSGFPVSLSGRAWRFGSMPSRPDVDGPQDFLPPALDATNLLSATWQTQWTNGTQIQGPLFTSQVDPALRVLSSGRREQVLWVSLANPPAAGGNGWATMTTSLSESGLDLSTTEFLEFYASTLGATSQNLALIIDVGTVSEDAFVLDAQGAPGGLGVLDQEADPVVGVWGIQDDTGLWGRACVSEPQATAFPLGDERANCANNNGFEDTEDLNRDNFLDTDERFFRYIVPLTQPSRFLNRVTGGEFQFSLYRIPLRAPDLQEGMTEQGLQNVRQIRITLVADQGAVVALSRMNMTGSRWLKRGGTGSVAGGVTTAPGTAASVTVGPISTKDAGYVPPPGIGDQKADRTDELRLSSGPINEQSLRLTYSDIPVGERIEVFRRFEETTRNFLVYGEGRVWTLPFGSDWGTAAGLRFFLKLGFDESNYYLYRASHAPGPASPTAADWGPENRIDFGPWLELRAAAEQRILDAGGSLPGDSTLVLWDVDILPGGDSTYALVIDDRSRAPNLAAVREIIVGVENIGVTPAGAGEIWIDDFRLDRATDEGGVATRGELNVEASDILSLQAAYRRENPFFRQLGTNPSFESSWGFDGQARIKLGRFLPDAWGLAIPVSVSHRRSGNSPFFLPETDVRAARIAALRTGKSTLTNVDVSVSKQTRSRSPILRSTLDGLRFGYTRSTTERFSTQTEAEGTSWTTSLAWNRPVVDKSIPLVPGFVKSFIDVFPDFISRSKLLENFKNLRLRLTPRTLGLGGSLANAHDRTRRFQTSIRRPGDRSVRPAVNRERTLRPTATAEVQPFPSLTASVDFSSARDLVGPRFRLQRERERQILRDEKRRVLGANVGWETNRSLGTRIDYRPDLAEWFTPNLSISTNYQSTRNASYVQVVNGKTVLVRDVRVNRDIRLGVQAFPDRFLSVFGLPDRKDAHGIAAGVREVWDRLQPVRFDWSELVNATFDRRDIDPGFSDQFVTGGIDALRISGKDTASAAARNRRWSVEGGYDLPLTLEAGVRYSRLDDRSLSFLNERGARETEWPSVDLRWRSVPLPGGPGRLVRSLNLTAGFRERERKTLTTTGQDIGDDLSSRSVSALLVFGNGFNLSYQYERTVDERTDATGFSKSTRNTHDVRATGTLRTENWAVLRRPLRVALAYSRNGNFDCRDLGGLGFGASPSTALGLLADCTAHVDQLTQTASLTLDTDFTGYSIGVQFSWVQRGSAVGQRQRTNQFNLNVFGRFVLSARELEAATSRDAPR